jgi:energy-coupling factor transporter ATP-binding protein EcfA2
VRAVAQRLRLNKGPLKENFYKPDGVLLFLGPTGVGKTELAKAVAEAMVAYAQPLIDETDGSMEAMNRALTLSQLCWNLALLPEDGRDQMLSEMRPSLHMDEDQFDEFRRSIIDPMIRRHQEMFPLMHRRGSTAASPSDSSPQVHSRAAGEAYPGAQPYAPCPCNSGRKYKFCCGAKAR